MDPSNKLDVALKTWSEWGESPEDSIETIRNYSMVQFINDITEPLGPGLLLYRFYDGKCVLGNEIIYDIPKSWSADLQTTQYMAEGFPNACFLQILTTKETMGIYNHQNVYGEEEYILPPMKLKIEEKIQLLNVGVNIVKIVEDTGGIIDIITSLDFIAL